MDICSGYSGFTKNEEDAQLGQLRESARRYCHSFCVLQDGSRTGKYFC